MSKVNNDLPTLQDKLEWAHELKRMVQRIVHCETPHVIGIHGDWGSGKTSFMRQLQRALGGEVRDSAAVQNLPGLQVDATYKKQIMTIWFDAWRYQNEPSPAVALLHEMRRQIPHLTAFKEQAKKLTEIGAASILDSLSLIGKLVSFEALPDVSKIEKRGEQWEKDHHHQTLATTSIREHLQQTFNALLPDKSAARIVIFIDDLDRCNPKAAMRLLEGLKIYLSIEKCVFVLGMNEGVLVDAIIDEFSGLKSAPSGEVSLRAAHYLEKICSDIYRLPLPASNAALLGHWLRENQADDAAQIEAQVQALQLAIGDDAVLPPNPRRLKALANQWARFAACEAMPDSESERKLWAAKVLIATYIHQFNRDLWERLQFDANFWDELASWTQFPNEDIALRKQWAGALKMPLLFDASSGAVRSNFPNPGDQTVFWIGKLIFDQRSNLRAVDFEPFLKQRMS